MKLPPRFDMTITRADFRRVLPAAVNHVQFTEEGDNFVHGDGARGWRINVAPIPELRLGLIRLERHQVDFKFTGYSADEIADFMARFEAHFRRGGG